MKKLLLAAAVAMSFGASAQNVVQLPGNLTTITGQPTDGGRYLIYDHSKPSTASNNDSGRRAFRYAPADGSSTTITGNPNANASSTSVLDYNQYVWVAEKVMEGDNTYWKFKHAGTGKYIEAAPSEKKPLHITAEAGLYSLTYNTTGEGFQVVSSVSTQAWDGLGSDVSYNMCTWGGQNGAVNEYHYYQFFEVTDDMILHPTYVTYQLEINGQTIDLQKDLVLPGATYTTNVTFSLPYDYTLSETLSGVTVPADKTIKVTMTNSDNVKPFKLWTARNNRWASMNATQLTTVESEDSGEWLMQLGEDTAFKMYSIAKGSYLKQSAMNGATCTTVKATNADDATTFKITRTANGLEVIDNTSATSVPLNIQSNNVNGWTGNDQGSKWMMVYDFEKWDANKPHLLGELNHIEPNAYTSPFQTAVEDATAFYANFTELADDPKVVALKAEIDKAPNLRFGRDDIDSYMTALSAAVNAVETAFTRITVNYTFHCADMNDDITGTMEMYQVNWHGAETEIPAFQGAEGYVLENAAYAEEGGNYTFTADITFPFPVSSATVENLTGIESELGNSKWYVNDANVPVARNAAHTQITYSNQDNYKWCIYPSFANGTFSFKIKHSNGGYIPAVSAQQATNTVNPLVEEASAGTYCFMPANNTNSGVQAYGFCSAANNGVFLTINSDGGDNGDVQMIWAWSKTGTHHGSNLTFPDVTVTIEDMQQQLATLAAAPKLDILEGSTVVGPNEIAAPVELNEAIDAANAVDTTDIEAIEAFLTSDNAAKISNYIAKDEQFGPIFTYHLTVTKTYDTMILPCPSAIPEGMTVSTVNAHDNGTLTLTHSDNIAAKTPYIVEATVGNKYTIIGWFKNHENTHTHGWLTGVLADDGVNELPDNAYILSENADHTRQAFVKATSAAARSRAAFTVNKHECYLVPSLAEGVEAPESFIFENAGTTSIFEVENAAPAIDAVYDLQGRRLGAPVKGINIIGGKKVLVK